MYPNETFRKEYIHFLVWLFYDNTTILRKTLDNFSKELEKDDKLRSLFKDGDKLKDIESFKTNIGSKEDKDSIKGILYEKIHSEYYYSSFKPYPDNEDRIGFVEKLIFVTYAKLKLEDLIVRKHKTSIESDLKALLEIFSEIMGADGAFISIKNCKKLIPMTLYEKKTNKENSILFLCIHSMNFGLYCNLSGITTN